MAAGVDVRLGVYKAVDRYVGALVCRVLAIWRTLRDAVRPRDSLVEPRTILMVKFWGLGNIVLLLPVVRLLRQRFPGSRLLFVSLARNRPLLDACDDLDERIYVSSRHLPALLWTLLRAVVLLRRRRPDVCIDFEQFARTSAILAELGGARQLVGLNTPRRGRAALHHKRVRYDDRQHMGQSYLDLARALGVQERLYRPERPPIPEAARAEAAELLGDRSPSGAPAAPLVVMHPGSGDNFQGRRWPAESFARLADDLIDLEDCRVVITGLAAEAPLVARVIAAMRRRDRVLDAAGRLSVVGLAALLDRATLLVTNDTAPVHLGSALGVPVFAFYGPNTPRLYGPLSRGSHAFYTALPCSPCLTNSNYKSSMCRMPVCIRDITVREVLDRIRGHLAERRAAAALRGSDAAAR